MHVKQHLCGMLLTTLTGRPNGQVGLFADSLRCGENLCERGYCGLLLQIVGDDGGEDLTLRFRSGRCRLGESGGACKNGADKLMAGNCVHGRTLLRLSLPVNYFPIYRRPTANDVGKLLLCETQQGPHSVLVSRVDNRPRKGNFTPSVVSRYAAVE